MSSCRDFNTSAELLDKDSVVFTTIFSAVRLAAPESPALESVRFVDTKSTIRGTSRSESMSPNPTHALGTPFSAPAFKAPPLCSLELF